MAAVIAPVDNPLRYRFLGMDFASPIVLLSGCVGFGEEYTRVEGFSNRDTGAVVLKGTSVDVVWPQMAALTIFAAVMLGMASLRLKREWR